MSSWTQGFETDLCMLQNWRTTNDTDLFLWGWVCQLFTSSTSHQDYWVLALLHQNKYQQTQSFQPQYLEKRLLELFIRTDNQTNDCSKYRLSLCLAPKQAKKEKEMQWDPADVGWWERTIAFSFVWIIRIKIISDRPFSFMPRIESSLHKYPQGSDWGIDAGVCNSKSILLSGFSQGAW